jgi:hypothetical protein
MALVGEKIGCLPYGWTVFSGGFGKDNTGTTKEQQRNNTGTTQLQHNHCVMIAGLSHNELLIADL